MQKKTAKQLTLICFIKILTESKKPMTLSEILDIIEVLGYDVPARSTLDNWLYDISIVYKLKKERKGKLYYYSVE